MGSVRLVGYGGIDEVGWVIWSRVGGVDGWDASCCMG